MVKKVSYGSCRFTRQGSGDIRSTGYGHPHRRPTSHERADRWTWAGSALGRGSPSVLPRHRVPDGSSGRAAGVATGRSGGEGGVEGTHVMRQKLVCRA